MTTSQDRAAVSSKILSRFLADDVWSHYKECSSMACASICSVFFNMPIIKKENYKKCFVEREMNQRCQTSEFILHLRKGNTEVDFPVFNKTIFYFLFCARVRVCVCIQVLTFQRQIVQFLCPLFIDKIFRGDKERVTCILVLSYIKEGVKSV